MTTKCSRRPKLWSGVMALVLAPLPGCELLVDFDRSKIPQDGGVADAMTVADGTTSDATASTDATADAQGDSAPLDAIVDALDASSADAGVDALLPDAAVTDGLPPADSLGESATGNDSGADSEPEAAPASDGPLDSADAATGDDSG